MAVASTAVTVATTATLLVTGGSGAGRTPGTNAAIKPAASGSAEVYLGGTDVSTANGFPLGTGIAMPLNDDEELYGIVASGTVAIRVLESGI